MNNFYGTRIVFSDTKGFTILKVRRSFWERWFTKPWTPWELYKTVKIPGFYKEDGIIYVHTSLTEQVSKIVNKDEDAPTLKVKTTK